MFSVVLLVLVLVYCKGVRFGRSLPCTFQAFLFTKPNEIDCNIADALHGDPGPLLYYV